MILPDSAACGRALAAMHKYYSIGAGLSSADYTQTVAFCFGRIAGGVALDAVEHNVQASTISSTARISCRPLAIKTAPQVVSPAGMAVDAAAEMALTIANQALHQCGEGDAEHDDQRREEHLVVAARDLEEDAQG